MGIEPMNLSKSVKWNLCKCLEMGVEPMNILKVCIYSFFFIPWWWCLSTMGLLLLLFMKLFIVYLDTINLAESHCTGVWEVYSWTIYQRLVLCRLVWRRSVFYAAQEKREIWNPVCICTRRVGGGGVLEREIFVSCPLHWS